MSSIKPIQTEYKGYKFRSRLEARWAIFFDALGVKWEYEPEGFELPNGQRYLPDFLLHDVVIRESTASGGKKSDLWVEVKPVDKITEYDAKRLIAFADAKFNGNYYQPQNPILLVTEIPEEDFTGSVDDIAYDSFPEENRKTDKETICPFNFELVDGDYFSAHLGINDDGEFALFGDDSTYFAYMDKEKTRQAYKLARSARFEFGETPEIKAI